MGPQQTEISLKPRASGCIGLILCSCVSSTTVDLLPANGESPSPGASVGAPTSLGGAAASGGTPMSLGGGAASGGAPMSSGGSSPPNASAGRNGYPRELIHLWDFDGSGIEVTDRVDGRVGKILGGAVLDGNGHLVISDGKSYVALPPHTLSSANSSSVTIATWITWYGGASWQRVFDFGSTEAVDGLPGQAIAHFYFTPRFEPRQYFSVLIDGDFASSGQATVESADAFPINVASYVAVVVEGDSQAGTSSLRLYLNGTRVGEPSTTPLRLSEFPDQNCWLGQSQWIQDSEPLTHWNGEFDEFRIYSRALSDSEIARLSLTDPSVL